MSGIYIHIPFCKQACNYCNFHFATSLVKKEAMVAALIHEVALSLDNSIPVINTIYFGGGTPSLLTAKEIESILKAIYSFYKVDEKAEITLEANPDDITVEKLQAWSVIGINRLSMGVQSFFEEDLQWMHRTHNATQAIAALELSLKYFNNITIDLIYGTPGLTNERWKQNIATVISMNVPHLSCYALTVEPKTPLDKLIRLHKKNDVNPAAQSEQFLLLMEWLNVAGYEHYEISNFAKPGFRSKHNSSYWQGKPYIGIGPSAHSYNGKERQWNIANNQKYIDAINKGNRPFESENLTAVQQLNELIMISLRTIEGINLNELGEKERDVLEKLSKKYIVQNMLTYTNGFLQLTNKGKLYADGIAADLFFDVL